MTDEQMLQGYLEGDTCLDSLALKLYKQGSASHAEALFQAYHEGYKDCIKDYRAGLITEEVGDDEC